MKEFKRLMGQPNAVFGDVIRKLEKGSGLSREVIRKIVGAGKDAGKPNVDVEKLLCEHLGVKSVPEAITRWIHEKTRGDETFARQLADTLCRIGILTVNDRECSMVDPAKFRFSEKAVSAPQTLRAASLAIVPDRNVRLLRSGEEITRIAAGIDGVEDCLLWWSGRMT